MTMPHSRSSPIQGVGYQNENDINLHIPYVFGSSRPRDLSYLDFLPAKLRVYNTRLRSSIRDAKDVVEPTLSDYLRQLRSTLTSTASPDRRPRDRSVDSASRYYVFGSSTPRDLSYLERIPWEFRIYDVKLGSRSRRGEKRSKTTSFSSTGSGGNGHGRHRRTSSLNILDSPSPNGKIEHTTRRLVRSAHENTTTTTPSNTKATTRQSPVSKSSKSSRPPSNASQGTEGSSQKVAVPRRKIEAKKTPARDDVTAPIEVQCPSSSPTSSALPSNELAAFEAASSPASDEFYIVPTIDLKHDTDAGLHDYEDGIDFQKSIDQGDRPQIDMSPNAILKTVEELHQVITTSEIDNQESTTIVERKFEQVHQVTTQITEQIEDLIQKKKDQFDDEERHPEAAIGKSVSIIDDHPIDHYNHQSISESKRDHHEITTDHHRIDSLDQEPIENRYSDHRDHEHRKEMSPPPIIVFDEEHHQKHELIDGSDHRGHGEVDDSYGGHPEIDTHHEQPKIDNHRGNQEIDNHGIDDHQGHQVIDNRVHQIDDQEHHLIDNREHQQIDDHQEHQIIDNHQEHQAIDNRGNHGIDTHRPDHQEIDNHHRQEEIEHHASVQHYNNRGNEIEDENRNPVDLVEEEIRQHIVKGVEQEIDTHGHHREIDPSQVSADHDHQIDFDHHEIDRDQRQSPSAVSIGEERQYKLIHSLVYDNATGLDEFDMDIAVHSRPHRRTGADSPRSRSSSVASQ